MKYLIEGMKVAGFEVPPPNKRVLKILLSPDLENTDKFTLLYSIVSPGNSTGSHTHDSDEVMYIASGRGEAVFGEEKGEIEADTVIFAPKHVEHDVRNTGEETLKLICFFIPPLKPAGYFEKAINEAKEYFKSFK